MRTRLLILASELPARRLHILKTRCVEYSASRSCRWNWRTCPPSRGLRVPGRRGAVRLRAATRSDTLRICTWCATSCLTTRTTSIGGITTMPTCNGAMRRPVLRVSQRLRATL